MTQFTTKQFKEWGEMGGKSTVRKYGKKGMSERGKLGGRPRKKIDSSIDKSKGLGNNQK
jgi:hypothetical protein